MYPNTAFASPAAQPGQFNTVEQLLEGSKNIFLVKLIDEDNSEIIEVLKGDKENYKPIRENISSEGPYSKSGFENHSDLTFWEFEEVGRGVPHLCGADITFYPGKKYLLFQELYGSVKRAEIIRNDDDKWYLYVKNKISNPGFDKYQLLEAKPNEQAPIHHGIWTVSWEPTFADALYGTEYDCSSIGHTDCSQYTMTIEFNDTYFVINYFNNKNEIVRPGVNTNYKYRRFDEYIIIKKLEPYTGREKIVLKVEGDYMKFISSPYAIHHLYKE